MTILYDLLDQPEHCRMMRVIETVQFVILTIHGKCILCEVIGSDAEEVHHPAKLIGYDRCGGSLDHNTFFHITKGNSVGGQLCTYSCRDLLDLFNLLRGGDHRIHHRDGSVGARSIDGTELSLKNLRTGQTDANGTEAERRVVFLIEMEIIRLLVGTNVECADNDFFASQCLRNGLVGLKLLFFCGHAVTSDVEKFTSEQSDAASVICQNRGKILKASDIGVQIDLPAVNRYVILSLQFLEQTPFLQILVLFCRHLMDNFLIRIQVEGTSMSVNDGHSSVPGRINRNIDECGNIHGPSKDCSVGVRGAEFCYKCEDLILVQLNGFTGHEIVGGYDHRLIEGGRRILAGKHGDHPFGDVLHICGASLKVFIFHFSKHFGEILAGNCGRVFGIYFFVFYHVVHGIVEVIILKQHRVNFKNSGILFSNFLHCVIVKLFELLDGFLSRLIISLNFRCGVLDFEAFYDIFLFSVKHDSSDCDTLENGFSLKFFHMPLYPF